MSNDRRNILFVTTNLQRYDAPGCNGGKVARTPVIDGLAKAGVDYRRCYTNNTLCQPVRCTMLTGVCPRSHRVFSNGVALPYETPTVAGLLSEAGYKTALIGKPHFDPGIEPERCFMEHRLPEEGSTGPYRGFDCVEFAWHSPRGLPGQLLGHYGQWLADSHPEHLDSFAPVRSQVSRCPTGWTVPPFPRRQTPADSGPSVHGTASCLDMVCISQRSTVTVGYVRSTNLPPREHRRASRSSSPATAWERGRSRASSKKGARVSPT